ncbi:MULTISPECIES: hypothetical protein [Brevibacterium]|uniref:Uncharacterized protein n=1 Tax=Brevibacterium antiquum CNRZ 918 TaxID=1255637 RepID=A0A2H1KFJ2_9MICO|nr:MULTISPECIES: hypothetical protein [Brevibacterium]SMX97932.1 hypothetical protein BANT918_02373 [Brevibacterium antiquum CNRZ 918]
MNDDAMIFAAVKMIESVRDDEEAITLCHSLLDLALRIGDTND